MPRFSIVTPTYNSEEYLEECIKSIMNQKFTDFEHIIVDGGSSDGTLDIIKKYEGKYNMRWISEKDNGMYDAINKGFKMATGEIYSWLNSDDMYLPWTLQVVNDVMCKHKISWCRGKLAFFNEEGSMFFSKSRLPYRATPTKWIRKGYCDNRVVGYLQQESMFWTADLWEKSGGLDSRYRLAGDYHLWVEFAKHETLFTVNTVLAGFRCHKGQLSSDKDKYIAELPKLSLGRMVLGKTRACLILLQVFNPAKGTIISVED